MDRRDACIAKLWRRGHNVKEIAEAIGLGDNSVRERVVALGLIGFGVKRYKGIGPAQPCPWRDEDVPMEERYIVPDESRWRQSRIVGMAQMLNDEYRESNFANILANQASDAEEAGDGDWLMEALATFTAAIEKLDRARRVLTDDNYRRACRETLEGVEQMRHRQPPPLRAVE